MPYDELLAKRIRNILSPYQKHLEEKKMIAGLVRCTKEKCLVVFVKEGLVVFMFSNNTAELPD